MKLTYGVEDRPRFSKTLVFAFQQMIAIMAATLLVPMLMSGFEIKNVAEGASNTMIFDPAAALFGAGIGTLVYVFLTKKRSPVFLGSSFTFLPAYAAVIGNNYGYLGVILGIAFAGAVYVVLSLIIKGVGSKWVNKIMPAIIIGPIVALIGLSLSGTATGWMATNGGDEYSLVTIVVGVFTFLMIVIASVKGSRNVKLIPFIVGIGAGYVLALALTLIGRAADVKSLQILSFEPFKQAFGTFRFTSILDYPKFTILRVFETWGQYEFDGTAVANIAITFVPIGIVELAQHIGDHKNLSNIINRDLITDPGLDKTLMGDGLGSIVGGIFGGAANTTYGESIGCVAITGNASIVSIICAAAGCMVLAFLTPFVAVINSIPKCVMGGACVALYGFIAVSGLQMLKHVDLGNSKNLFVVSAILVVGIGGLTLNFGSNSLTGGYLFTVSSLAVALICGIVTNLVVNNGKMGDVKETDGLSGHVEHMGEVKPEDGRR